MASERKGRLRTGHVLLEAEDKPEGLRLERQVEREERPSARHTLLTAGKALFPLVLPEKFL